MCLLMFANAEQAGTISEMKGIPWKSMTTHNLDNGTFLYTDQVQVFLNHLRKWKKPRIICFIVFLF